MSYNVKFLKGTQAAYDALGSYDNGTLYFITDANKQALYLGDQKLTSVAEVANMVNWVEGTGGLNDKLDLLILALRGIDYTKASSVKTYIDTVVTQFNDTVGDVLGLTTEQKTIVAAINELKHIIDTNTGNSTAISVDVDETDSTRTYTIKQDNNPIQSIEVPKNLSIKSGRVITTKFNGNNYVNVDDDLESIPVRSEGTFLELSIMNSTQRVYIDVTNLVDKYRVPEIQPQVRISITNNVISAEIVDGSIGEQALAAASVTTEKIADKNVTLNKLAKSVQNAITDSVKSVREGNNNGTILVDDQSVAVHGLGNAAYRSSSDFDPAGSAESVLGRARDLAGSPTVHGVRNALVTWDAF